MKKDNEMTNKEYCNIVLVRLAVGLAEETKAPLMSVADEEFAVEDACPCCIEAARWYFYIMKTLERTKCQGKHHTH